jgi:hypothetical protein
MVFSLMDGFQEYHKLSMPKKLKSQMGIEEKNDNDNAKILNTHFHSIFNSQVEIDPTVLNELPQHEVDHTLGTLPSKSKIKNAIKNMAHDKSPGQSDLSTDMIKNLPPQALNPYIDFILEFWHNKRLTSPHGTPQFSTHCKRERATPKIPTIIVGFPQRDIS